MVLDSQLCIRRMNAVAEQLTGWSRQQASGKPVAMIFKAVSGRSGDAIDCPAAKAMATGTPTELARDILLVDRAGNNSQIAAKATPITGFESWFGSLVLVFHDVERAHWVREERMVATIAFETSTPQIVADATGKILRANNVMVALSGYSLDEFMKFNLRRDIFAHQRDPELRALLCGEGQRVSWSGATLRPDKGGVLRHVWDTVTAVRNQSGDITHYVVSMQDVTQLVEASSALDESRRIYHSLIESIGDGVVFVNDGVIVESNERYARMMGYSRSEVIGRRVAELSASIQLDGTPSSQGALDQRVSELLRHGGGSVDWSMVRADGSRVENQQTHCRQDEHRRN
jgi:PAS domain S-box-containing protein